jgi:hypothetical protein
MNCGAIAVTIPLKKTSFDRDEIKSLCPILNKYTRAAMEVESMQQVLHYQSLKRSMGDAFPRTLIIWTRVKELRTNGRGIRIPATTEDFYYTVTKGSHLTYA